MYWYRSIKSLADDEGIFIFMNLVKGIFSQAEVTISLSYARSIMLDIHRCYQPVLAFIVFKCCSNLHPTVKWSRPHSHQSICSFIFTPLSQLVNHTIFLVMWPCFDQWKSRKYLCCINICFRLPRLLVTEWSQVRRPHVYRRHFYDPCSMHIFVFTVRPKSGAGHPSGKHCSAFIPWLHISPRPNANESVKSSN